MNADIAAPSARSAPRFARRNPSYRPGRKVFHADWARCVGETQLYQPDRRRCMRQLRAPLSYCRDTDGSVQRATPSPPRARGQREAWRQAGDDSCNKRGALHWLWRLREPLPGAPVQRNIRGRARSAQHGLITTGKCKIPKTSYSWTIKAKNKYPDATS